ncbi:NUDIX domain-containing protein [Glycomyces paridis]|uniref:NUDIX domain-containing protein n=1 Tax=Glycomyces paridis TaxID=2126555 RepID=A0A4S8PBZ5_9ACTN|nr:NUDIX domain-containing protein [Glycomyces paridis]THV26682.1 NUDIX domain-containing protein [Glycomyces paridis]
MSEETGPRRCARVIVVDEHDRVLLLHSSGFVTPESEFFVSVGGGIDPGETAAEAAARELFEETGLRVEPDALVGPIGHTVGTWWLGHEDHVFFLLRTNRFEVRFDWLEACEIGELTGSAWLTVDELRAVDAGVFPVPIADLAERVVGGDIPSAPVELAWVNWRGDNKRYPLSTPDTIEGTA